MRKSMRKINVLKNYLFYGTDAAFLCRLITLLAFDIYSCFFKAKPKRKILKPGDKLLTIAGSFSIFEVFYLDWKRQIGKDSLVVVIMPDRFRAGVCQFTEKVYSGLLKLFGTNRLPVYFIRAELENLPIKPLSFDAFISNGWDHVPFKETNATVKTGGVIAIN